MPFPTVTPIFLITQLPFLWNDSVGWTRQCASHFTSLTLFNFLKNNRTLFKIFSSQGLNRGLLAQYWSAEFSSGHIVFSTAYAHCQWANDGLLCPPAHSTADALVLSGGMEQLPLRAPTQQLPLRARHLAWRGLSLSGEG